MGRTRLTPDEYRARAAEREILQRHGSWADRHPTLSTVAIIAFLAYAIGPIVLYALGYGKL